MIDLFQVKVYLVTAAIESKKDQSQFLVIGNGPETSFPNIPLSRETTTKDLAVRLLREYTGVTQDWAILFPFGVIDDVDPHKEDIIVLYGVFIPGITRIRKDSSHWITYQNLSIEADIPSLTKKLAYEAIWRQA